MIDVIYLAGGQGIRAKLGHPKQYEYIGGKPMLIHGIEKLRKIKEVGTIIIPSDSMKKVAGILEAFNIKNYIVIRGGGTRQESVSKGLENVSSEYVLISEAVRPFVTKELVKKVIDRNGDFVVPIRRSMSSVVTTYGQAINRDLVGEVQCPQKYSTSILKYCHEKGKGANYTDDAALVIDVLKKVPIVFFGEELNIKITTPADLFIANSIYTMIEGYKEE